MAAAPTVDNLAALLNRDLSGAAQTAQAQQALNIAYWAARSFTRNAGFDQDGTVASDVRVAILMAAARILANPQLAGYSETEGPSSLSASAWQGFTVGEQLILSRYRPSVVC